MDADEEAEVEVVEVPDMVTGSTRGITAVERRVGGGGGYILEVQPRYGVLKPRNVPELRRVQGSKAGPDKR